jgi:hypothetical protein
MKEKIQERFELTVLVGIFVISLLGVNPNV